MRHVRSSENVHNRHNSVQKLTAKKSELAVCKTLGILSKLSKHPQKHLWPEGSSQEVAAVADLAERHFRDQYNLGRRRRRARETRELGTKNEDRDDGGDTNSPAPAPRRRGLLVRAPPRVRALRRAQAGRRH